MRRAAHILLLTVSAATGCGGGEQKIERTPSVDRVEEPDVDRQDLRRDLETSILESYSQLTLGNLEAYREGIAAERPVTLIGVLPGDVAQGESPEAIGRDRRLYREVGPEILSKNLDVYLSRDGSIGWVYDEVSYRVPHMGRTASIPIRWSGVYLRDLDRWVQVLEHQSYAVPIEDIAQMASEGQLPSPTALEDRYEREEGAASLILNILGRTHNAPRDYRREKLAGDDDSLLLLPHPDGEFRGQEVPEASSLSSVFGAEATVGLRDYQIFIAPSGSVAWAAANLVVRTQVGDDSVEIELRATYVLEDRPGGGWQVVLTHTSVPLTREQLSRRVFGPEPSPT